MINNDQELRTTYERIKRFLDQVLLLRQVETNPDNYRLSVSGYLAEIDRMNLEIRDYLWVHSNELSDALVPVGAD